MTNVDQTSVDHFSAHARQWWTPDGPLRTLHQLNPLRLKYITSQCHIHQQRILDVGCGGGLLAEALATEGALEVCGIDLSESLIEVAKAHGASIPNLNYQCISSSSHRANQHSYDIITCMELLEHVPDPEQLLDDLIHMLNPNGYLFVSTINQHWQAFLSNIIVGEYVLKILPKGSHHYEQLIKPSQLCAWARGKGVSLKNMTGFFYRLGEQSFYLRKSLNTNYMAVFKKG